MIVNRTGSKQCVYVCVTEVILKFRDLISKLEKDIDAVMKLEREERELAASEAKVHLYTWCPKVNWLHSCQAIRIKSSHTHI